MKTLIKHLKTFALQIFFTIILFSQTSAQNRSDSSITLKAIIEKSIAKSNQVKIQELNIEKTKNDRSRAYEAYLPRITGEVSFTHLNDDIRLPSSLETLLTKTQMLLIKESATMQMAGMNIPATYKVNFATPYNDATTPSGQALMKAINENMQDVPPIQRADILKANLSAQMVLFSGMKVPYLIKAANHQISALEMLSEKEKTNIIKEVVKTYDQLALIDKSEEVLNKSENYLNEQAKFVEKAFKTGLATDLEKQKIQLAKQQLLSKRIELNSNKKLIVLKLEQLSGIAENELSNIHPKLNNWFVKDENYDVNQRNDVKALEQAIIATDFKRKSEYTEYIPKLVAFGKKELIKKDLSTFDPQWYVGVGLRWNIFDGFTAHNNAQTAKLDRQILEEKKQEAVELLNLNLQKVKFEIEKNNQLTAAAQQQVKTAQEMFDITKKQYEVGLVTMTEYLASINTLETAQLEVIKCKYQQRQASVELLDAVGKISMENVVE